MAPLEGALFFKYRGVFMNWFKNALETLVLDLDWIIFCMILCSTRFLASKKSLNLCCPKKYIPQKRLPEEGQRDALSRGRTWFCCRDGFDVVPKKVPKFQLPQYLYHLGIN
jgi:hypothetical protein